MRLYLKIPEEFVSLILKNIFWVLYIPFVRMVKLQFFAQFLVDHIIIIIAQGFQTDIWSHVFHFVLSFASLCVLSN